MTIDDIRAEVEKIRAMAGSPNYDNEEAHCMEDALYKAVLRAIADSDDADTMKAMAAEALKASEIEFSRWYA